MRAVAVAMMMFLMGGLNASAQPAEREFKSTVAGVAGAGKTWDDEGQIGTGAMLGARADRRLFGNTFAEVSVDYQRHVRTGRFSADGHGLLLTGSLVQRFGRGRAQPYALAGITLAHHTGTYGFPEANVFNETKSTNPGVAVGGGVAIGAGTRYEVGPEARFLILASHTDAAPAFAYWVGVRFGVRF